MDLRVDGNPKKNVSHKLNMEGTPSGSDIQVPPTPEVPSQAAEEQSPPSPEVPQDFIKMLQGSNQDPNEELDWDERKKKAIAHLIATNPLFKDYTVDTFKQVCEESTELQFYFVDYIFGFF